MEDFSAAHGIKFAALRYFNASGADPECETGELARSRDASHPAHNLRPRSDARRHKNFRPRLRHARRHSRARLRPRDGPRLRAPEGARKLKSDGKNLKLNLGTGSGYSVLEVIKSVERVSGKKVPSHDAPRRAGDPPVLVADSTAAQQTLGWQLKHSSIDEIVETAIRCMKGTDSNKNRRSCEYAKLRRLTPCVKCALFALHTG